MDIYLPVAYATLDLYKLVALGCASGVVGSMFGLGGGVVAVPGLISMNVHPTVAIFSNLHQGMASSFVATWNSIKDGTIDRSLLCFTFIGGYFGSRFSAYLLGYLDDAGKSFAYAMMMISYFSVLSVVTYIMATETLPAAYRRYFKGDLMKRDMLEPSSDIGGRVRLPWQRVFERSQVTISLLSPIAVGFVSSTVSWFSGISGSFVLMPTMVYLFKIPYGVAAGTCSAYGTLFVLTLIIFSSENIDVVLSTVLFFAVSMGGAIGSRIIKHLSQDDLKALFTLTLLIMGMLMLYVALHPPHQPFTYAIIH